MDAANPELLNRVSNLIIENRRDYWIDIHQLRAWKSGDHIHIDLHLVLPQYFSLDDAHSEAKSLEKIIVDHFEGKASALIHMDPCSEPDCPVCRNHQCQLRQEPTLEKTTWGLETLIHNRGSDKFFKKKHESDQ
jgi:divalent metal cation (Fe/Co/Zn/Cd) transporter